MCWLRSKLSSRTMIAKMEPTDVSMITSPYKVDTKTQPITIHKCQRQEPTVLYRAALSFICPLFLVCSLSGCGGSDAPPQATIKVAVTVDGKPAPSGLQVVLAPTLKGAPVGISLDDTGHGTGKAVIGENMVTIVALTPPDGAHVSVDSKGVAAVFTTGDTPLKANVEKTGENSFTFEVGKDAAKALAKSAHAAHGGHGGK